MQRYKSLVGQLIYLTHTRPDMAFAVGILSRYMNKPSKTHVRAREQVLRHLAGSMDFELWYTHAAKYKLEGYTNITGRKYRI